MRIAIVMVAVTALLMLSGCYKGQMIASMTPEERAQMQREREAREEAAIAAQGPSYYQSHPQELIGQPAELAFRALGPPTSIVGLPGGGAVADFDMGPAALSGFAHREKGLLALMGQYQASRGRCVVRLTFDAQEVVSSVDLVGGC